MPSGDWVAGAGSILRYDEEHAGWLIGPPGLEIKGLPLCKIHTTLANVWTFREDLGKLLVEARNALKVASASDDEVVTEPAKSSANTSAQASRNASKTSTKTSKMNTKTKAKASTRASKQSADRGGKCADKEGSGCVVCGKGNTFEHKCATCNKHVHTAVIGCSWNDGLRSRCKACHPQRDAAWVDP